MKNRTISIFLLFVASLGFGQSFQTIQQKMEVFLRKDKPVHFKLSTDYSVTPPKEIMNLSEMLVFQLDAVTLRSIFYSAPDLLELEVPSSAGIITLRLLKSQIYRSTFRVRASSTQSVQPILRGVHYRGYNVNLPNEMCAFSFFLDECMGLIYTDNGNFAIGRSGYGGPPDMYTIHKDRKGFDESVSCAIAEETSYVEDVKVMDKDEFLKKSGEKCLGLYLEVDHDVFLENGSNLSITANFITALINNVIFLYENEAIKMELTEIMIWDTPSLFTAVSAIGFLNEFKLLRPDFEGDIAHLINRQKPLGGQSYTESLCTNTCYGFSGIAESFSTAPAYSHSVYVITHEIGHNLGSKHTHNCSWPGGAIDDCFAPEGVCLPGPTPVNGGTIMSYCHVTSGGINFNNGFGALPGGKIRDEVDQATCLSLCEDTISNSGGLLIGAMFELDWNVYPNPMSGNEKLTILTQDRIEGVKTVKIYNTLGEQIRTIHFEGQQLEIQLELSAGVYTVELTLENKHKDSKLLLFN